MNIFFHAPVLLIESSALTSLYLLAGVSIVLIVIIVFMYNNATRKLKSNLAVLEEKLTELEKLASKKEVKIKKLQAKISSLKNGEDDTESIIEEQVAMRTEKLKAMNEELDLFLYRSAQDFRQPLTTLKGLNSLAVVALKDEFSRSLFEKVGETASQMEKVLQKFSILHEVLSLSDKPNLVNSETVLFHAKDNLEDRLTQINIESEISKNNGSFKSYAQLIEHIIFILLENALDFVNPHSPEAPSIKVMLQQSASEMLIKVSDNGVGIQESVQPRIFEMYFRANEHSKGKGLGLYIAKKAVEALEGSITFESKLGVGTTFTVSLPSFN
ncbi:HAMP domain-containing sensor histidine kinase [Flammeovirgaceae bacterium SG7u.111]|nr:HAMP domain-containing sensor histidine kinase [Flammeovirgaceae bacterium SG7u.132]WPO33831.1 HAMP domain-containing sensor histidine kinase [Flammeovirgaceae bacterium SG7u.111]